MIRALPGVVLFVLSVSARAMPADHLASVLGNRVAGTPVDCIDRLDIDAVHVVTGAIVYEAKPGRVFYLNRPSSGGNFLHDGVVLTVDFAQPRFCSGEQVGAVYSGSRVPIARVTLGQFIPYTRQPRP